ncbi:MAG: type II secretion system F family protein [Alphaproteobacteria bacterium]|nr:type II secretion system F family protein [Alphaproteobacteria bacterium]
MPAFQYQALDPKGTPTQGLLEADSERQVRQTLRGQGLIPLSVLAVGSVPNATPWWRRPIYWRQVLHGDALVTFTRQLAGLIEAGLTLDRTLSALMEDAPPRQSALLAELRAEVNAGHSLAQAMASHGDEFPAVYQAVIAAGEQSGQFGAILLQLASDLEADHQLRHKVLAALLYPAVVSGVAILIVLFLLGMVVPQLAQVFSHNQQTLPGLTVFMLAVSGLVQSAGWPTLALLVLGGWLVRRALRQPSLRRRYDRAWLQLPGIGQWLRHYHAARLASTMSSLTRAGVPILKALSAASATVPNLALREDLQHATELVREGAPLAVALTHQGQWPRLLAMFIRLGEQTGQLPQMLAQVALQLREQVQRRSLQWATLLEPLLILLMGGVVMLIVLSVMLPILQLNQMVK